VTLTPATTEKPPRTSLATSQRALAS